MNILLIGLYPNRLSEDTHLETLYVLTQPLNGIEDLDLAVVIIIDP
jgi:hypothetical protein